MIQYAERDAVALDDAGRYYIRHVIAMTREKLHEKSDIAAELAFRDMQIDALTKQRDELLYALKKIASVKPSLMHDENQQEVIVYSPYYNPFKIARDAIADKQEE